MNYVYFFLKKYILVYINILIYIYKYIYIWIMVWKMAFCTGVSWQLWNPGRCMAARMSVDGLRWSVRKKLVNRRWGCCQSKDPRGKTCARARKKICANPKMIKMIKDDWLGMRRKGHHRYFNIAPKSRSHHLQRGWEKSLQHVICQRVSLVVQLGSYILKLIIKQYNFDS